MPTVILYAVEIAEMERWVGSRDASLLREAKQVVREEEEADWEKEELALLDRLLERMIQAGQLYDGLPAEETYYLTQLLIDLFDEFVESEAVSDPMPLEELDQALKRLAAGDAALEPACRWLTRGRLLGTTRVAWEPGVEEPDLPYFGYVRRDELAPLARAAAEAARRADRPPRGRGRDRADGILTQFAAACREALDTERDLLSFVS